MKKTIIELKNVWKIFKMGEIDLVALNNINLKVNDGDFLAIVGPSGSGKSTSMNLVGCLDLPSKGSIYLNGQNIAHMGENQLARIRGKKIGFIFQQFNLIPTLTALENVMLPMIFQKKDKQQRIERAKKLLTRFGLSDRINHKPGELSGGQQQRVAIARALANDPEIILADEPTGNLDSKTGINVLTFLKELNTDEKKTIIIVTHDLYVAKQATKIVHLQDGQIIKIEDNKITRGKK